MGTGLSSLEEQLILSQLQCPSVPPASISPMLRLEVYEPHPVHGVLGTEPRASCIPKPFLLVRFDQNKNIYLLKIQNIIQISLES